MSEAQALARSLYAKDPRISSADLAQACGRTKRWATGELAKLRGTAVVDASKIIAAEPSKGKSKPSLTIVPTTEPKPIAKPAERRTEAPRAISAPRPDGTRIVWAAFATGLLASIAANALSARHGVGPMLAAAFAPVALLLSVEVIARTTWMRSGRRWKLAKYVGTGTVAAVAGIVSYGHQRHLLLTFGESTLSATILPLAVDGLILVSATALVGMKGEK